MDAPTSADTRRRLVEWEDPRAALAVLRQTNGLEYLQGVVAGRLPAPPIARLLNIRLVEVERGRAVFEAEPEESHYNPLGIVHGGLAATILDSAMGCSVHSCLEAEDRYTTLEIKVNYLKAMTVETGRVRAIGTVLHIGRTTALTEARLVGRDDTLYAHGTSTLLIKRAAIGSQIVRPRTHSVAASTSSGPSE